MLNPIVRDVDNRYEILETRDNNIVNKYKPNLVMHSKPTCMLMGLINKCSCPTIREEVVPHIYMMGIFCFIYLCTYC